MKRKASSPEHSAEPVSADKSSNSKESSAAIRAQRRRTRKEEGNGGTDLCAKYVIMFNANLFRMFFNAFDLFIHRLLACRLTTERQDLANLILSEINRKMMSVVWTP